MLMIASRSTFEAMQDEITQLSEDNTLLRHENAVLVEQNAAMLSAVQRLTESSAQLLDAFRASHSPITVSPGTLLA